MTGGLVTTVMPERVNLVRIILGITGRLRKQANLGTSRPRPRHFRLFCSRLCSRGFVFDALEAIAGVVTVVTGRFDLVADGLGVFNAGDDALRPNG
jgi:hypothetical protein